MIALWRLISLLENRRLKADAREALVAFGESVIPILVHFMNDPGESILVRRALPMTLARIDAPGTVEALVAATVGLILKIIESRSEKVGAIIASVLGMGWSAITYFVVPVIVGLAGGALVRRRFAARRAVA